jgi:hypothetical protein
VRTAVDFFFFFRFFGVSLEVVVSGHTYVREVLLVVP